MSESILVTGVIDFDPAKRDDAIAVIVPYLEACRGEQGCEHYSFSGDFSDPGRIHVSEQWANEADMDAHSASPHFAALVGAMGSFGVSSASLTKWTGATSSKLM